MVGLGGSTVSWYFNESAKAAYMVGQITYPYSPCDKPRIQFPHAQNIRGGYHMDYRRVALRGFALSVVQGQ